MALLRIQRLDSVVADQAKDYAVMTGGGAEAEAAYTTAIENLKHDSFIASKVFGSVLPFRDVDAAMMLVNLYTSHARQSGLSHKDAMAEVVQRYQVPNYPTIEDAIKRRDEISGRTAFTRGYRDIPMSAVASAMLYSEEKQGGSELAEKFQRALDNICRDEDMVLNAKTPGHAPTTSEIAIDKLLGQGWSRMRTDPMRMPDDEIHYAVNQHQSPRFATQDEAQEYVATIARFSGLSSGLTKG